jgi:hypothetical protein
MPGPSYHPSFDHPNNIRKVIQAISTNVYCFEATYFHKVAISTTFFFFLVGEGPRSRCYGRTAALRLIVQPCDEDEQFFTKCLQVM